MADKFDTQISEHVRVVEHLRAQADLLEQIADRLITIFRKDGKLLLLGNGGSAADAQHIAAELVGRFKKNRRALPAIALTTDSSILTAVGNDYSAEQIFVRQVEALATKDDAVWALSVSGMSPNVIAAVARAKEIGSTIIGFTGRSGGKLIGLCDFCLRADHEMSDRVQEAHVLAYHLVCDRIEQAYL